MFRKIVVVGAAVLSLMQGGCATITTIRNGEPDPSVPTALLQSQGLASGGDQNLANVLCPKGDGVNCYWQGKSLIDYRYQVYKTTLLHAANTGSFVGDFVNLGLTTAGAVTPAGATARLLAALASAATGTKALVNQDILYKQTITLLMSEMDSDRAAIASGVDKKPKGDAYTVPMAVNDLLAYYEAGTFQHALVTLQNKAGAASPATQSSSAAATATATISGTITAGTVYEIDGTGAATTLAATYTAQKGDGGDQVAAGLAAFANAHFAASASVKFTASGDTIAISGPTGINWAPAGAGASAITIK